MNNYTKEIESKDLKWIFIDLDGTLSESIWPEPGIGLIKHGAKNTLDKLTKLGYKIIVYTARPWSHYESIEKWCLDNKLIIRRIVCGKPLFRWVIDDRNIEFRNSWENIIDKIQEYEKNI